MLMRSMIRAYVLAPLDRISRDLGQFSTVPPGTQRDPITRSADSSAVSMAGSSAGSCEPSASISTTTP